MEIYKRIKQKFAGKRPKQHSLKIYFTLQL